MKTAFHWLVLVFSICLSANVHSQSCCASSEKLQLCYLSSADYCFSNNGRCFEYSLDGENMRNALAIKLLTPVNFGIDGLVNCEFDLKKLPINLTATRINDCNCDIVFMPAVFVEPASNQVQSDSTFLPPEVLDAVYEWSLECPNNLAIVSQGEARRWGYAVENINQNPNRPQIGNPFNLLFDGPFGQISNFEQGGSFQGVFTRLPSSGFEILATDGQGRPTLTYDLATGDLIAGDIGIFCNGPGDVSQGPMIVTNNDVLACNIFALACELASGTKYTNQIEELCQGAPIFLPNGDEANSLGTYIDTLTAFNGCDSIIQIELVECVEVQVPNIFSPNGDGRNDFFLPIGSNKIQLLQFQVFNRWGQMVYNNDAPATGWDGTFNGEPLPTDVYVFQIRYRNLISDEEVVERGDVTLVR